MMMVVVLSICAHVHFDIYTAYAYKFWIDKMMMASTQTTRCIQTATTKTIEKLCGISNFYYEIHIHRIHFELLKWHFFSLAFTMVALNKKKTFTKKTPKERQWWKKSYIKKQQQRIVDDKNISLRNIVFSIQQKDIIYVCTNHRIELVGTMGEDVFNSCSD